MTSTIATTPETTAIDCHYIRPEFAAAFLLVQGDEAAFVEANTTVALPHLLAALDASGRRPEQVRWIAVTHVHLDHAGGASALMAACPNATLLCHPRAARHLIDPSRLVTSARAVYGAQAFERLYGRIDPIDAARVQVMADGETLSWGGRELTFLHTRGHANHHFCIFDAATGGVFAGDSFGLRYPCLQSAGLFVLPSTSPTDFHPQEARKSVRRIQEYADHVWLTHYGRLDDVDAAAAQLHAHLDFAEALLHEAAASDLPEEALAAFCTKKVRTRVEEELEDRGLALDLAGWQVLGLDLQLNAQGIAWAAGLLRRSASC